MIKIYALFLIIHGLLMASRDYLVYTAQIIPLSGRPTINAIHYTGIFNPVC